MANKKVFVSGCHRLHETTAGARLGTLAPIRGGHRKDRPLVSGQSGLDG